MKVAEGIPADNRVPVETLIMLDGTWRTPVSRFAAGATFRRTTTLSFVFGLIITRLLSSRAAARRLFS